MIKKIPTVRGFVRLLSSALISVGFLTSLATAQPDAIVDTPSFRSGIVFTRSGAYDYVPAIMKQGDYKMWWGGGVIGDYILYAESSSISGPWHSRTSATANTKDTALQPTNNHQSFDSLHTCDPSVILWRGKYYLYYGGLPQDDDTAYTSLTRIGVARSDNGATGFTRLNSGAPIVDTSGPAATVTWVSGNSYAIGDKVFYLNKQYVCEVATSSTTTPATNTAEWRKEYGAGQPSVVAPGDGWIYMFFTDTTSAGAGVITGGGIFVIRSTDPTFQTNTEELQSAGTFVSIGSANNRTGAYRILNAFSVDVVYSDVLENFIVASGGATKDTGRLYFFPADLSASTGTLVLAYDQDWSEGPGIVRGPEGRALPGPANELDLIPMDIYYSYQTTSGAKDPSKWDIYYCGYDLIADVDQLTLDSRVGNLFRGWKVQAPSLPLTYVTSEATRLQCQSSGTPNLLTDNLYSLSSTYFYTIPFGAVLPTGAIAWGATARPAAFNMNFDTSRIWPVNNGSLISANGSTITTVTQPTYDAKGVGPGLFLTDW